MNDYDLILGDSIVEMNRMEAASIDFAVTSPPFPSVFAYGSKEADIGNSEDLRGEGRLHLGFFYSQLSRIVKPGRVVMIHVNQIPRMKRSGEVGLFDFRGLNIRLGERAGLVFEYDWCSARNPQSQAIRTRSRELQFAGLEADRAKSRGALPDYLLKFRAPGENAVPVESKGDVSRNQWIEWAECCWTGIRETDTLNAREGRSENDTRHICALQLPIINRLIRLYTNPGELVFDPFAGIGSSGHEAIKLGRRFLGVDLKEEYYQAALKNLERAKAARDEVAVDLLTGVA